MKPKSRERITEERIPPRLRWIPSPRGKSCASLIARIIGWRRRFARPSPRLRAPWIWPSRPSEWRAAGLLGRRISGRLGVLDAAECAPTFGSDRVVAVLAGAPARSVALDGRRRGQSATGREGFRENQVHRARPAGGDFRQWSSALCSGRYAVCATAARQGCCSYLRCGSSYGGTC